MRLERTTPLRESAIVRSGLPGRALNRIERDHGARTVGELLQLILNADIDADFQAAFGLSNEAVRTLAGDLLGALPREHASAIQAPADFVLGAELEDGGPPALSAPPRRQILPDRCSMVEDLLPVADQGRRGSCVSQAATAVNELSRATGLGILIEAEKIPVLEAGRMFCGRLGLNPLGAFASGALLICVDPADVKTLLAALGEAGIPAAAIRKLLPESEGVRMLKDGRKTEIPVFNMDEIGKIF